MRSLWLALALSLCASAAEAQIQQGTFKLSIDTDVLNFAVQTTEDSEDEFTETETQTTFSLGPGGSALFVGLPGYVGFTFGYVAHPHVIPQLRLSLSNGSGSSEYEFDGESEDADLPSVSAIMLQPELEIPFNPDHGVVAFGLFGFDFRHFGIDDDEEEVSQTINAYGPVLGAGMHVFAGEGIASFDLSAQFSYLVVNSETEIDGESEESDIDRSISMFSINAGLSLWP